MLLILHGISSLKILFILCLNFLLSTSPKPGVLARMWPALLIVGNMVLLFLNERNDGYKLGQLHANFDPLVGPSRQSRVADDEQPRTHWEAYFPGGM
jgi:hypothetical protein